MSRPVFRDIDVYDLDKFVDVSGFLFDHGIPYRIDFEVMDVVTSGDDISSPDTPSFFRDSRDGDWLFAIFHARFASVDEACILFKKMEEDGLIARVDN